MELQRPTDNADASELLDTAAQNVTDVQELVENSEYDEAITKLDDIIQQLQTIRQSLEEWK